MEKKLASLKFLLNKNKKSFLALIVVVILFIVDEQLIFYFVSNNSQLSQTLVLSASALLTLIGIAIVGYLIFQIFSLLKIEESLLIDKYKLNKLIEVISASQAFVQLRSSGEIMYANSIFAELTGYSSEELIGANHAILVTNEFAKSEEYKNFWRNLNSGKLHKGIYKRVKKDGSLLIISATYAPVLNDDGTIDYIFKYCFDVTNEIQERENFAFVASHDLKEPLRKIISFSKILIDESKDKLEEQSIYYLSRIQDGALRMEKLLDSLLSFVNVANNNLIIESVNLQNLINEVLDDLEQNIKANMAQINLTCDENFMSDLDRIQMKRVFQNIVANALKYRQVNINPVIDIKCTVIDSNHYQIDIIDNGIGFEQEYEAKIFQQFQRLHGKNEYEGIGMGLATVKKILEKHNAAITVKSAPGLGSTFTIKLPIKQC